MPWRSVGRHQRYSRRGLILDDAFDSDEPQTVISVSEGRLRAKVIDAKGCNTAIIKLKNRCGGCLHLADVAALSRFESADNRELPVARPAHQVQACECRPR